MFENLSDRLEKSFKLLKGEGKITEINVAETLKDIRRALLDADVNFKIAKQFTDDVKDKALGQQPQLEFKEQFILGLLPHIAVFVGSVVFISAILFYLFKTKRTKEIE